jgi:hypothetical protein
MVLARELEERTRKLDLAEEKEIDEVLAQQAYGQCCSMTAYGQYCSMTAYGQYCSMTESIPVAYSLRHSAAALSYT